MNDQETIRLQFLGQSGFRLVVAGTELVVDPYLSDAVAESSSEPARWRRAYAAPVDPSGMTEVVAVACTHEHGDHVDPATIEAIMSASPGAVLLLPGAADVALPDALDDRVVATRGDGDMHRVGPFTITAVPAAHSATYSTEITPAGHRWQGFLIEAAGRRVYHAGDTVPYDGQLDAVLGRGPLDLAILPVNGRDPYRERHDVVGNMWPREAVELALELGVECFVPCHHDLFPFNGIAVGQVADYAVQSGAQLDVRCLTAGAWTELAAHTPTNEGMPQ